MRPYYLPQEFTHVSIAVYVPPSTSPDAALQMLLSSTSKVQTRQSQVLFIISGEATHLFSTAVLPTFLQYVTCPTRDNTILDMFYAHTKGAHFSCLPLVWAQLTIVLSFYSLCFDQSSCGAPKLKRWTTEKEEALMDCFMVRALKPTVLVKEKKTAFRSGS